MFVQQSWTAAQVTQGVNLASGQYWEKSPYWRKIQHLALTGSAAAGDCILELYYGNVKVGEILNSVTGVFTNEEIFNHTSQVMCPPNQSIAVVVKDAAATNPVYLYMDILEVVNK